MVIVKIARKFLDSRKVAWCGSSVALRQGLKNTYRKFSRGYVVDKGGEHWDQSRVWCNYQVGAAQVISYNLVTVCFMICSILSILFILLWLGQEYSIQLEPTGYSLTSTYTTLASCHRGRYPLPGRYTIPTSLYGEKGDDPNMPIWCGRRKCSDVAGYRVDIT